jgi:hypothetical protein
VTSYGSPFLRPRRVTTASCPYVEPGFGRWHGATRRGLCCRQHELRGVAEAPTEQCQPGGARRLRTDDWRLGSRQTDAELLVTRWRQRLSNGRCYGLRYVTHVLYKTRSCVRFAAPASRGLDLVNYCCEERCHTSRWSTNIRWGRYLQLDPLRKTSRKTVHFRVSVHIPLNRFTGLRSRCFQVTKFWQDVYRETRNTCRD